MGRLDDIEKQINDRMDEISRRLGGSPGPGGNPPDMPTMGTPQDSDASPLFAPVNPDYVEWTQGRSAASEFGLVPSPVDFSYLGRLAVPTRDAGALPARYDMRELGQLPPVRDQGKNGTCWAHAALASLESSLLKECGQTVDLSENNLANLSGFSMGFNGGFPELATAYFLRWRGPVLERDDPYGRPGQSKPLPPVLHLQSIRIIPQMQNASDTSRIKQTVKDLGGVWVGYMHDETSESYRKDTSAFYLAGNPTNNRCGHAVTIVGWDDNFPAARFAVAPPGNGAWIVRNSWGEGFGDKGYFYVSYHDRTFGKWLPGYAYSGADVVANYSAVLQYDPLGFLDAIGNSERMTAANVFRASRTVSVKAVGLYALVPNAAYRIRVYGGCGTDRPDSGGLASEISGTSDWPGYLTVKLPTPASVAAGQSFSVVVEMTTPGWRYPIAVERAVPRFSKEDISAEPGQGYVLVPDGQWIDLTRLDRTCSFCCKAYVDYA